MKTLQHGNPVANVHDGGDCITAAERCLAKAGTALVERAAGTGLAADVAALYRDDPPRFATWS